MGETVLGIVKEACRRMGQVQPGQLTTSQDAGIQQFGGLLNSVGRSLSKRFRWQEQHKRVTWTSPGTELQGTVLSIFGAEAEQIVGCTLWDLSNKMPLRGAIPTIEVQEQLNFGLIVGPVSEYAMYDSNLYIYPAPAVNTSFNAFIRSKNWVIAPGGVKSDKINTDNDVTIFDDELLIVGLMYFWKQEKGLAYAEDMRSFEEMAGNAAAYNTPHPTIYLSGGGSLKPYVPNVPQ